MAQHWRRMRQGPVDRLRLWINGTGALTTGAALVIILVAKFSEGAWLTIVVIPLTLLLLKSTRRYYRDLERQVLGGSRRALDLRDRAPPTIVIPLERWDRIAHRAIHVATRLSPDVVALHLSDLEGPDVVEHEMRLRLEWTRFVEQPAAAAGLSAPCLRLEPSPYRSVLAPLLREVQALRQRFPGRPTIVVLSELAGGRWWEAALHTRRTQRLRMQVLRHGGPDVSVLVMPWQLELPETEQVLAEEEPEAAAAPALTPDAPTQDGTTSWKWPTA
jgi:hypothetical protein